MGGGGRRDNMAKVQKRKINKVKNPVRYWLNKKNPHKKTCKCPFCKAKRGESKGKYHPTYKDGRTLKKYFCSCGKPIHFITAIYKKGKCCSCANKIKNLGRKRLDQSLRMRGKNHWNYKGLKPLELLIRGDIKYKEWRRKIYERDDYTCQECSQNGDNLEAHHIKEFAVILQDFLQEYNQFSSIEDKETLIRLAITYTPFWDISNGITLCKDCHKKTESYAIKKGEK